MADRVQRLLEAMIPELEDYRRRQLFSPSELHSIVEQRTQFEYRLQRTLPVKSDYLFYIRYELNLDALRRKRRQRAAASSAQSGSSKASVSDHAIRSRVAFLFERALRRFHTDAALWTEYVHFLRESGSHRLLSRVLPRMHLLHPGDAGLWLLEAQYHMDEGDVDAMRVTMQRALRLNAHSAPLWLRFFAHEIEYTAKVMERKRVLGINVREEDASTAADLDIRYKVGAPPAPSSSSSAPLTALDDVVLHARLPAVIFRNAIASPADKDRQYLVPRKKRKRGAAPPAPSTASLASSLAFRLAFLALIPSSANERFTLAAYEGRAGSALVAAFMEHNEKTYVRAVDFGPLIEEVYQSIEKDFPDVAEAWTVRAARVGQGHGGVERACAVFEEGVARGVRGLSKEYFAYLTEALEKPDAVGRSALVRRFEAAVEALRGKPPMDDDAVKLAAQLLQRLRRTSDARSLLAAACASSGRADLWLERIRLTSVPERQRLYDEALTRVDEAERYAVHVDRLQSLVQASPASSHSSVLAQFQAVLASCPHPSLVALYTDYLSSLLSSSVLTLSSLRVLVSSLPALPALASLHLIRLYLTHQAELDPSTASYIRSLWERVVSDDPSNVATWREWIRTEREHGEPRFAHQLLWRAAKHIPDSEHASLSQPS